MDPVVEEPMMSESSSRAAAATGGEAVLRGIFLFFTHLCHFT